MYVGFGSFVNFENKNKDSTFGHTYRYIVPGRYESMAKTTSGRCYQFDVYHLLETRRFLSKISKNIYIISAI